MPIKVARLFNNWLSSSPPETIDSPIVNLPNQQKEKLTLYTQNAINTLQGRIANKEKNLAPVLGFYSYAKTITAIWDDAKHGYPYAFWWLIQIADQQIAHREKLIKKQEELYQLINPSKDLYPQQTLQGNSFTINSKNPYSVNQIKLIQQLDETIFLLYQLKEDKVIKPNQFYKEVKYFRRKIIAIHELARRYQPIPVTKTDIHTQTEKYFQAQEKMGEVPTNILKNSRIPPYFPHNIKIC